MPTRHYQGYPGTPLADAVTKLGMAYLSGVKSPVEQAESEAQIRYRDALTRQAAAQAGLSENELAGRKAYAGAITPQNLTDPAGLAAAFQGAINAGSEKGIGDLLLAARAHLTPDASPDELIRARTGAGLVTKPGEGVTDADRQAQFDQAAQQARALEGMQQAGATQRQSMSDAAAGSRNQSSLAAAYKLAMEKARLEQSSPRPMEVSAGASLVNPRTGEVIHQSPARPASAAAPLEVQPGDLERIMLGAFSSIPGATIAPDPDRPTQYEIDPQALELLDPATLAAARQEIARVYQQTRDAAQAEQAFMRALGLQPGTTFQPYQDNWGPSNTPAAFVPPPGATAPAPRSAPAPAAPPPAAAPAGIPAPEQRQPGMVYQTPRGPMKWTGTGWLPAT